MKHWFISAASVLAAASLCIAPALAGTTSQNAAPPPRPLAVPHAVIQMDRIPPAHSMQVPPSALPEKRSRAADWKQNWQPNWMSYCQRWVIGPQGEVLNPYCYVPLFGLFGYMPASVFGSPFPAGSPF